MPRTPSLARLAREVRACEICAADLPLGPRPVLQVHAESRVLIAGQAPGSRVHETGVPFDDPSGDRLREWMGIDKSVFYDAKQIAILPMGFCYPGTGSSGDLPPRRECADHWRERLLAALPEVRLTLVVGKYAMDWHLRESRRKTLTETVQEWKSHASHGVIPLPHPSPRNNIWLKKNAWFTSEVLPALRRRVMDALRTTD